MSKQTVAEMAAQIRLKLHDGTHGVWQREAVSDAVRVTIGTGRSKVIIARLNPPQMPESETTANADLIVYLRNHALDIAEALEDSVLTLAAGDMHVTIRISDKDLAIEMGRLIAENERLKLECECLTAGKCMAVARLAGIVEGRPTETINYLQRIDELREKEVRLEKAEALLRRVESRLPFRRGIATYFADQRI